MNAYEQGFVEKCAQYGIDHNELMKEAARTDMLVNALKQIEMMMGKGQTIRAPKHDVKHTVGGLLGKLTGEVTDPNLAGAVNKTYAPGSYAESVMKGLADLGRSAKSNVQTAKSLTKGTTKKPTTAVKATPKPKAKAKPE